jgi:C1A family cysteine protease
LVVFWGEVTSWKIIQTDAKTKSDDPYLVEMMKSGPCNIGVDASCLSGYKDGVITNCTGKAVDHANVIVGAGTTPVTEDSIDYFIVRNSWGTSFGEDGYYKVERNTGQMKIDACWHAYY